MKILLFNWNNILTDVEKELKKRGHTILPIDGTKETLDQAEVAIVWNETSLGGWTEMVENFNKKGIKTILVQHGRRGTSRIYPPFNEKSVSKFICAWSENDRKRLISCGVEPEKIRVTGTSIFKHLNARVPHDGFNVVFSPEHWDHDVVENFVVSEELKKLKGVKVWTKTLAGFQAEEMYQNVVSSGRDDPNHLEILADLLAKTDLVVCVAESTLELMAEILDIPVVVADVWIPKACDGDDRYKEYHREYSDACTKVPLDKLNATIMEQLKHPEILRAERKRIGIDDGGINIADPVGNIVRIIENG